MSAAYPTPKTNASHDLPLEALAARVGEELDALAILSARVQSALSLCDFSEHTAPEAIRGLQGIDRITQALEDLGRLMMAISNELPPDIHVQSVPLLSQLRLRELIRSLDQGNPAGKVPTESVGEVQWF